MQLSPPHAQVGVADGAKTNWPFLTQHTERQILDFYHAAEYLTIVADAQLARDPKARIQWLNDACKSLKHDPAGPQVLIAQMSAFSVENQQPGPRDKIKTPLKYFHAPTAFIELLRTLTTKLAFGFGSY